MQIGELEKATGVNRHALRFYEREGLLPPVVRHANNYRDYPDRAVADVSFIRQAQALGFSLAEIRDILAAMRDSQMDCEAGAKLVGIKLAEVDRKIVELQNLRQHLADEQARLEDSARQQKGR